VTRILIEATFDGGSIGEVHPAMDLDAVPWHEFFLPLAQLVYAAHPDAVWTCTTLADDETEKHALLGY
jgi:hypothetical protein